jgi:hypothetical protein
MGCETHSSFVLHLPPKGTYTHGFCGGSWLVTTTHLGSGRVSARLPAALRYAQPSGVAGAVAATHLGVSSHASWGGAVCVG